ncbi:hypothetical protein WJX72_003618 [[Myrmecia] bisecta]|uniref:Uncharacterized protein n=1 Tax=[Myrmecia] bisecta TaxID=41462 RepID=A0AAW1QPZ4_9CHLO
MGGSHRRIIANPDQHPDFPREADAVDDGFPGASRMSGPGMVLGGRGMHPGASQHFLGMTGPGISPMDSRMGPRMMPGNGMRPGPGYSRPEDELNYPRFDDRFEPEPDRQMRTGDMHLGPGMPMSDDFARNGLMPHQDLGPGLHGNGMMPDQDMPFRDTPARPARHIETGNGPMHSFPHADEMDDFPPHLAGGEGQPRQHLGGMQPSNQGGGRLKGSSGGHGPRHISNEQYPPGDLGNLPRFMQEGIRDVVQHWSPHLRLEHFNTRVVNCIGTLQPTQMGVLLNRMRHTIEWDNLKFPPSFIVSTIKSLRKHQA